MTEEQLGPAVKWLRISLVSAIQNESYYAAGRMIAYSVLNGGPLPNFMSHLLCRLIIGDVDYSTIPIEAAGQEANILTEVYLMLRSDRSNNVRQRA